MKRVLFKWVGLSAITLIVGLILFYGVICLSIYSEVNSVSEYARQRYEGEAVLAIVKLLESPDTDFEIKNRTVYALGQIGDEAALVALKNQKSGISCPKPCTKKGYICQYNLDKAIRTCEGQFSATKWMYRFL